MKWFRPLIIAVILGVAAFGLTRLNEMLKAAPPVMTSEAGAVLYAEMFEEANDEWLTYDGRLSSRIADGILKIDVGESYSGPFVPTRWHFADFDAQVIAAAVGGPEDNGYGIVFRMKDRNNYYRFVIAANGYYQVVRAVNGVEHEISDDNLRSDAIHTGLGAVNKIRVVGRGDTFQFFVNDTLLDLCITNDPNAISTYSGGVCIEGQMLDHMTDSTHATGQLGLIAVTLMEPDVSVAFDNFVVTMPE